MNQLLFARLFTMSWLLLALLLGLFLTPASASNRDRNGQHRQQMGRNHHHRRYTNLPKTVVERDDAMRPVAEMASSTTKTTGPYSPFLMVDDDSTKTMIPVQASLNGNIFMHCPVDINEDFQVSWIRLPDWRIVASGRHIYNKDERFRVLHAEGTPEWTLQIKYAALIDQGLYECQVSTGTGIMIYYYNVSVAVPTTSIVGGSEYHVDKDSAIQLTCVIRNIPQEPQFIFWYHNDRMINYDSSLGLESVAFENDLGGSSGSSSSTSTSHNQNGSRTRTRPRVEVMTEIDSTSMETDRPSADDLSDTDRVVTSQLTIHDVTDVDSGNYTCSPSNAEPASTMVYVSEGDDAAAAIQVSVGETTNVSDVASSAASSASAASTASSPTASSSRSAASLTVLVVCFLTVVNGHVRR